MNARRQHMRCVRVPQPVQSDLAAALLNELGDCLREAVRLEGEGVALHDDMVIRRHTHADRQHCLRLREPVPPQLLDHEGGEGDRTSAA